MCYYCYKHCYKATLTRSGSCAYTCVDRTWCVSWSPQVWIWVKFHVPIFCFWWNRRRKCWCGSQPELTWNCRDPHQSQFEAYPLDRRFWYSKSDPLIVKLRFTIFEVIVRVALRATRVYIILVISKFVSAFGWQGVTCYAVRGVPEGHQ